MNKLYGLLGEKSGHSVSPKIHFEIFKELNLDCHYHLFEVEKNSLEDAFAGFKALNIRGINVTIPYKIDVMNLLDEIPKEAERIKAVNTIHFIDNRAVGYNTDYYGFGMMLDKFNIPVKNKRAFILGTGGSSKAVTAYLIDNHISDITMVSRDISESKKKISDLKIISYSDMEGDNYGDIIINCTPCGMYPNVNHSPVKKEYISKFEAAIDLIYNPKKTRFLAYAKECELKAVNGLYMLVAQAVKAEEIWNDTSIGTDITDRIYNKIDALI